MLTVQSVHIFPVNLHPSYVSLTSYREDKNESHEQVTTSGDGWHVLKCDIGVLLLLHYMLVKALLFSHTDRP